MTTTERRSPRLRNRIRRWFLDGSSDHRKTIKADHQAAWPKVMCLTGVDYFSTLGYQPGIAFLAAGLLSPMATVIVVLLTLFGALPVYSRVAGKSPHGQGSIAMLESLLPGWNGKLLVLCLLGFAATDFIITITLSAADAAAHLAQNPWLPHMLQNKMLLTMIMVAILGGVFLKGFREAIGLSVILVVSYLALNVVVIGVGLNSIAHQPQVFADWTTKIFKEHGSIFQMIGISLLLFPKLALGMSGFETGVAVMPHVRGRDNDDPQMPEGRIHNTRLLLLTAAVIMGVFLISSSIVTTMLIPPELFEHGNEADGRALAYLAYTLLGSHFGTIYDISTILILWFAGASAMTGLLNLVPRYLPRYGMAPNWTRATRPLVVFFTMIGFAVTVAFRADVDAQGGAYATGVLVLMSSAALACMLTAWKESWFARITFLTITGVFFYTTAMNSVERPDGLKIASLFILIILVTSLISRVMRSTELRVDMVAFDDEARRFIEEATSKGEIRIVAHRPGLKDYDQKAKESTEVHIIPENEIIFLEVQIRDASEFGDEVLEVAGSQIGPYKVLKCESLAVPNAIAAILLTIRNKTRKLPHVYLGWTEGNPVIYILKYLFFGEGETAPMTREILREAEHDPDYRPKVHVG
jgi:hypothetical protein